MVEVVGWVDEVGEGREVEGNEGKEGVARSSLPEEEWFGINKSLYRYCNRSDIPVKT